MSLFNNFSKKELQQMDIHQLRNLARCIGVPSPTSKKKELLVSYILDIISGKSSPEYKNINRGRPAKFKATSNTDTNSYSAMFSEFSANSIAASPSNSYVVDVFTGVVSILENGAKIKKYKFADSVQDAFLPKNMVDLYGLKNNDVITYQIIGKKISLLTINDKPAQIQGNLQIDEKTICFGKLNLLQGLTIQQKRELILQTEQYGKVILLPSCKSVDISSANTLVVDSNFSSDEELIASFLSCIDVATYFKKSGEVVTVVADNFAQVMSATKTYNGGMPQQEICQKLLEFVSDKATFVAFVPANLPNIEFKNFKFDNIV